MITASALERVISCPASESLPHIRRESQAAKAGTARHTYLQFVGEEGVLAALRVPHEYRSICLDIDLDGLPTNLAAEVAFAYDVKTGEARELGRGLSRDYSQCSKTEIPGTIDVLGFSEGRLYVGDYKGPGFIRARGNKQLLFAAMCAAKVYGMRDVLAEIINVRNGDCFRNSWSPTFEELDEFERELVRAYEATLPGPGKDFSYTEGEHCRYCPGYDSCPAKTRTLKMMLEWAPEPAFDEDDAKAAYENLLKMKERVARAEDRLKSYAEHRTIDLGDGKAYGLHEKTGRDVIDSDIVAEVVESCIPGHGYAELAAPRVATKKSITSMVAAAINNEVIEGPKSEAVKNITEQIRQQGGITNKRTATIGPYKT